MATPARAEASLWYFKTGAGEYGEGDRFLGATVPEQRRIAKEFQSLGQPEILKLLHSPWHEERLVALLILVRRYQSGTDGVREAVFRLYLDNLDRVNNWDLVDLSAPRIVGMHLLSGGRGLLRELARSSVLWERRVAILATLPLINEGRYRDTLVLARIMLHDPHDLIHKAVGWMLREVANRDRAVTERFLDRHAAVMPRTMLRYAIEKFPPRLREKYMNRRERGGGKGRASR